VSFYDEVLRELLVAIGGALFVANVLALSRRRADAERVVQRTVARNRPGSPVRGYRVGDGTHDLPQAPLVRSVLYAVIGFVVMVWGIASLIAT
jgi:hypothetical protein